MTVIAPRFQPPEIALSPVDRWVLVRAFGPVGQSAPVGSSKVALAAARLFGLGSRIAARHGHESLVAELGSEAAEHLFLDHVSAEAFQRRIERSVQQLGEASGELDVPVALLKFAGLWAVGVVKPGGRIAVDLDVLVPARAARGFHQGLIGRGYRPVAERGSERHLPGLVHPQHRTVEIHDRLLGVRIGGERRSADFGRLQDCGLLKRLPTLPGDCRVPRRELLAAHALVHGLAQHGHRPDSYPLLRVIADLIDLSPTDEQVEALVPWVVGSLSEAEARGAVALARQLERGSIPATDGDGAQAAESRLLRHLVAAYRDHGYAISLEARGLRWPVTDESAARFLARKVRSALLPTRRQLEAAYGPAPSRWRTLAGRIRRPVDLTAQVLRSWIADRGTRGRRH